MEKQFPRSKRSPFSENSFQIHSLCRDEKDDSFSKYLVSIPTDIGLNDLMNLGRKRLEKVKLFPKFSRLSPHLKETPKRSKLDARNDRFSYDDFEFFWLSVHSPFHLSLAVLVLYRSPTECLALGGVYHPEYIKTALSSSSTLGLVSFLSIHEWLLSCFGRS